MANDTSSNNKNRIWIASGVAIIILIIVFGVGLVLGRASWQVGPNGMGFHDSMMGGRWNGWVSFSQERLSGVVTAVNGSNFTVGGNGATNTITTNSSTEWQDGDSVKVNDSVVVIGSTSNNTFTATRVWINP